MKQGDKGCIYWTGLTMKQIQESEKSLPYVCINCKCCFEEIPKKKANECQSGYYHDIIKRKDIIER